MLPVVAPLEVVPDDEPVPLPELPSPDEPEVDVPWVLPLLEALVLPPDVDPVEDAELLVVELPLEVPPLLEPAPH